MLKHKDLRQYLFRKKRGLLPNAYKENYRQFIKMLRDVPCAGCNGGNKDAPLWFFGMENNPGKTERGEPLRGLAHNKKLRACTPGYTSLPDQTMTGFNATLRDVVHALGLAENVQTADELYSPDAGFYCANLYPFALNKRNGTAALEDVYKLTGMPSIEAYEQACCTYRAGCDAWRDFTSAARVVVCFCRGADVCGASTHWLDCLGMMTRTWGQFGDLADQYDVAVARGDEVIKITSGDRTFVFVDYPIRKKDYNARISALANVIRDAMAGQGIK